MCIRDSGGPPAHRQEDRAAAHHHERAAANVEQQGAPDLAAVAAQQLHRAVLLEALDRRAPPYLLGEPIHDLDAGEVALVDGPVVGLPRERLLVDAPVRMAIEEAAVARLELQDAPGGFLDQGVDQLS